MQYEQFLELSRRRRTIRGFKSDHIPDDYVMKILDASRYAMSGANSQPWEFLIVKDPKTKEKLYEVRLEDWEMVYNVEQMRVQKYRHPAYNVDPEDKYKSRDMLFGWKDAPVLIIVLEDPRKMFGSALCARADLPTCSGSVLAVSMGHVEMAMHLAAASLGLGSGHVDVLTQDGYRQILKIPEPVRIGVIVPIGYAAYEAGPPHRLPLEDQVHFEKYDMSKFLRNEDFLKYIDKIRALGRPGYRVMLGDVKRA